MWEQDWEEKIWQVYIACPDQDAITFRGYSKDFEFLWGYVKVYTCSRNSDFGFEFSDPK